METMIRLTSSCRMQLVIASYVASVQRDNHLGLPASKCSSKLTRWSEFTVRPLNRYGDDLERTDEEFEFVLAKDDQDCQQRPLRDGAKTVQYPSSSSDSSHCFEQVLRWYNTCKEQHEKCAHSHRYLPTRLLDVASNDGNPDCIRLVDTEHFLEASEPVQYVALSYCWGESQNIVTTRENIDDHLKGITLERLPPTLRDAVQVTNQLGFRYLWVDALCICQDDQDEWETEAEKMSDVYGGSTLTISAMCNSDTNERFLRDRKLRCISVGEVSVSYGTRKDSIQLFIRRRPRDLRADFLHCPLNKRAWPLQERVLSPSVIDFCRDQLIWECNTDHLRSETGETMDWSEVVIRLSDMVGAPYSVSHRSDLWDCIVREYAGRHLKNSGDRLPAISSLASKLRTGGTRYGCYVAGLWEDDLDFQLL